MSALLENFLSRLEKVRKTGKQYSAKCPAHADRGPSLTIREEGGKILCHCFAGCSTIEILDSIGLKWSDLFEESLSEKARLQTHVKRLESDLQRIETTLLFYASDMKKGELDQKGKLRYAATIVEKHQTREQYNHIRHLLLNA